MHKKTIDKEIARKRGRKSKNKGKVGEREVAKLLRFFGYDAKRGVQYQGGNDSPDVVSELDDVIHIEVKRVESFRLYAALAQASNDAKDTQIPVVFHRKNNDEWVVVIKAKDFLGKIMPEVKPPSNDLDIFM